MGLMVLGLLLAGCGGKNSPPQGPVSGSDKTGKTRVLEAGSRILQDTTPIEQLQIYLNGFHYAAGNPKDQMEAHHYCAKLNEEVTQCALYDGNNRQAALIGVEYVISDALFQTLSPSEKASWHPHYYEVGSGQLIAPGLPRVAEHELMETLYTTHGKTWHIWDTRRQALPTGKPMLMQGFTRDGQLDPAFITHRDARFKTDTTEKRRNRADIPWERFSGEKH